MRSSLKKGLGIILAGVVAAGCLAGCGAASNGGNSVGTASSSVDNIAASNGKDLLDKILADGTITIGVNPPGEPICFYDDNGNLIGYDIDWANKLGEVLGVDVKFVEVNSENRISAVTSGRVDVIFANITGNLERAKSIDFSLPYLKTGIKLATRKGLDDVQTVEDLNDPKYTVAVGSGTTGEQLVLQDAPNCNISYIASFADQCLALQEGKADAILEDGTSIDYAASKGDYMDVKDKLYTSDPICIGYAKGNPELGRYLDMFVSSMISSGYQADEYSKWFGTEFKGTLNTLW